MTRGKVTYYPNILNSFVDPCLGYDIVEYIVGTEEDPKAIGPSSCYWIVPGTIKYRPLEETAHTNKKEK